MYDNHPYLARLMVKELYSDVERNARVAAAVRDARRARRAARLRRLTAVVHGIERLRIRPVRRTLDRPVAPLP
jgi:hypothetical protein